MNKLENEKIDADINVLEQQIIALEKGKRVYNGYKIETVNESLLSNPIYWY